MDIKITLIALILNQQFLHTMTWTNIKHLPIQESTAMQLNFDIHAVDWPKVIDRLLDDTNDPVRLCHSLLHLGEFVIQNTLCEGWLQFEPDLDLYCDDVEDVSSILFRVSLLLDVQRRCHAGYFYIGRRCRPQI